MAKYGNYEKLRDERRSQIIDITKRLARENGIAGTNMSDIALQAGISRQTLYKYFSGVDEIAYAAVKKIIESASRYIASEGEAAGTDSASQAVCWQDNLRTKPIERIISIMNAFFDYADSYSSDFLFVSIFDTFYNSRPPIENLSADYRGFLQEFTSSEKFCENVRSGKADGTIRAELDENAAYEFFINTVFALAQRTSILKSSGAISNQSVSAVKNELATAVRLYLKA